MEDLKILTESVCRIAREAEYFLKEERRNVLLCCRFF